MGIDLVIAVEHRLPGGRWRRAEELVPNPYCRGYWENAEGGALSFPTLEGETIHDTWSFSYRDHWLYQVDWPAWHPVPHDLTQESRELFNALTHSDESLSLTLQHLEETDWVQAYTPGPTVSSTQREREEYIPGIRDTVLERLRPLGAPGDVRLIYGWSV